MEKLAEKLEDKYSTLNEGNLELAKELIDEIYKKDYTLNATWLTDAREFKQLVMKTSRSGALDYMGISLKMTNVFFQYSGKFLRRFRAVSEGCLRMGLFPEEWKRDQIMFLYKNKGDRMMPENRRPITIAPSIGKHLEKVICYAVSGCDDRNYDNHAYAKGKSCMTAILEVQRRLLMAKRKYRAGKRYKFISFVSADDIQSAFESVDHQMIFWALSNMYAGEKDWKVAEIIKSYLDRVAMVIDKETGRTIRLRRVFLLKTTPQGSLISPFLWRIYDGIFTKLYKDGLEMMMEEASFVVETDHVSYADDHLTIITIRVEVDQDEVEIGREMVRALRLVRL